MKTNRREELIKICLISSFVAFALLFYYIESFLPPLIVVVPFAKIGLANIAVILCFVLMGGKEAFIVQILRCLIGALFVGNVFSLVYSLPAGIISLCVFALLFRCFSKYINIVVISVIAAIVHNIIQVLMASLIAGNIYIVSILPYLLLASVISGIITGLVSKKIVKETSSKLSQI